MATSTDLKKFVGKDHKIEGLAFDAKAGAIVFTQGKVPIYIDNLPYWPSEMIGKEIIVKGILRFEEYIPKAEVDPSGAISTGIDPEGDSKSYVLMSAEWKLK